MAFNEPGDANAKEDLREKVKARTRMMMDVNKMMKLIMLQREDRHADPWASVITG